MHPILFRLGSLEVHSYDVMVAVAAVLAGLERFLVEFIRRNQHVLLGLSQPQLFAAALGLIGVALLIRAPARGAQMSPSAPATA